MTSFQTTITPKRRAAVRYVHQVRRKFQKAFAEEAAQRGLTQTEIAAALGVHRSVISRELSGRANLTLLRVGELAWAMGRTIRFELEAPDKLTNANMPSVATIAPKFEPVDAGRIKPKAVKNAPAQTVWHKTYA